METTDFADAMCAQPTNTRAQQRLFSGAIAHLTRYLDDGCYRSAYLATMLLERLADISSDPGLSEQVRRLVETLDRKATEDHDWLGYSVAPATARVRRHATRHDRPRNDT